MTNIQTPSDAFGAQPVQPAGQPYNPGRFETPGIHNHSVQSNDLFGSMEAVRPGFSQMSPADKANAFRSMAGVAPVDSTPGPTMPAPGQTVQTPYGTVSGPRVPNWQDKLVQKYPELGDANTDHNKQFVQDFHAAGADPAKAEEIAQNVYRRIETGGGSRSANGTAPVGPSATDESNANDAEGAPANDPPNLGALANQNDYASGQALTNPLKGALSTLAQKGADVGNAIASTVTKTRGALGFPNQPTVPLTAKDSEDAFNTSQSTDTNIGY